MIARNRAESLDVIEQRRRCPRARHRRKRRLHARNAALAFDRIEQRGFFAALVRARARMRVQIEIEAGARDVLAEIALRVRFRDGAIHEIDQIAILAADIDVAGVRVDRQAGDQDALDHLVRIVLHQQPVLAGARLALIRVDDDVFRLGRSARNEAPLQTGREIPRRRGRAAPTPSLHR